MTEIGVKTKMSRKAGEDHTIILSLPGEMCLKGPQQVAVRTFIAGVSAVRCFSINEKEAVLGLSCGFSEDRVRSFLYLQLPTIQKKIIDACENGVDGRGLLPRNEGPFLHSNCRGKRGGVHHY